MKPLLVLFTVFILALLIFRFTQNEWELVHSGNIAMSIMLLFTAFGHFKFANGMAMMLPDFVPYKKAFVYITGIAEAIMGFALLFPQYRYASGIALIIFLVLVLPANIGAAFRRIDYEKAGYGGKGPEYLWFRIPMQIFLLSWVFYFSVFNV